MRQQLRVRPLLHQPPVIHHQDRVGRQDRAQPVGDHQARPPNHDPLQRLLDQRLGLAVQRRRGLVQHEDAGILQDHAGDCQPLFLAAREPVAAVAHDCFVAVGQVGDELVDVRRPARGLNLVLGRVGPGIEQVGADRVVEQIRLLGDHADVVGQRGQRQVADVGAVDGDPAARRVVQAWQQVGDRRLARAAGADQRGQLPRLHAEADVAQRPTGAPRCDLGRPGAVARRRPVAPAQRLAADLRERGRRAPRAPAHARHLAQADGYDPRHFLARLVAERHILEPHRPGDSLELARVGPFLDLHRHIQHLEHPLEADHRLGEIHRRVGQRRQRPVEHPQVGGEGDDGADGEAGAVQHEQAADPEDERRAHRADQAQRQHEPAHQERLADARVTHPARPVAEAARLVARPVEQLDQQRAADVERLVHQRVHLAVERKLIAHDATQPPAQDARRDDEQRQHRHGEERQPPLQRDHDRQRADQRDQVGDDVHDRAVDRPLGAAHVVVQPRHELAGLGVGEEAQRHALHVAEQRPAQVVDHALTHRRAPVALHHAEQADHQRHRDHAEGQPTEPAEVLLRQGVVDQIPRQQGRDQAEQGGGDDDRQHPRDLAHVGPPVARHPPDERRRHHRAVLLVVVAQVGPPASVMHCGAFLPRGPIARAIPLSALCLGHTPESYPPGAAASTPRRPPFGGFRAAVRRISPTHCRPRPKAVSWGRWNRSPGFAR